MLSKKLQPRPLPTGYGYEYGGIAREEAQSGGAKTVFVYIICVVLIYLILSCLYESFLIPLAVILSVPFGLMGSFLFAKLFGLENQHLPADRCYHAYRFAFEDGHPDYRVCP